MRMNNHEVLVASWTKRRIRKMDDQLQKKYEDALHSLKTNSLKKLSFFGKLIELSNDSYLYRVTLKERLLFAERDGVRVVIEAGTAEDIYERMMKKMEEHLQ